MFDAVTDHTHRRGARRRLGLAALTGAAGLLALTLPAAATATGAKKALTPLQQGLNYYKGKTITFIITGSPGGTFYGIDSSIEPFMASYLGATINLESVPEASGVQGEDQMAASTPNGLTIGNLDFGSDADHIVSRTPYINFNPLKEQMLGGNGAAGGAGMTCLDSSPYANFADVVHSRTPVIELDQANGTTGLDQTLLNAAFGINARVIGTYTSSSLLAQGFERGDGQCSPLTIVNLGSFLAAGKARYVLVNKLPNPAIGFYATTTTPSAMLFSTAEKKFPAKTKLETEGRAAYLALTSTGVGIEVAAPSRTPADEVTALRAAVEAALTNVKCEDELLALGISNGWVTGPRSLKALKNEIQVLKPFKNLIAQAIGG